MKIRLKETQAKLGSFWPKLFSFILLISIFLIFSGCSSSLQKAKVDFTRAEALNKAYQEEEAVSFYKKSLEEANREIKKKPSSQAYLLRGLNEVNLNRWDEAEESFRLAASLGDDRAETWATEVGLYGLALSLEKQRMDEASARLYSSLAEKGKFSPVVMAAVSRLIDSKLKLIAEASPAQKDKLLNECLKIIEKPLSENLAIGYYHYLLAQVLGYQKKYRDSFEEAVMATELGLPTEKISRDNDNQIIFCYRQLKNELSPEEWKSFSSIYNSWIKKWKWLDETTPTWKRRE
ncbi:MAG: hypothetical protein ACP5SQ_00670 [Candidatus Saccharicenans sp.]